MDPLTADRLTELAGLDGTFDQDGADAVCITPRGAGADVDGGELSELLVLTYAEAELYQQMNANDVHIDDRVTLRALERLGRLRRQNLEELGSLEDLDVPLDEIKQRVRRGLAAHLSAEAREIRGWDATTVKDLVEALTGLTVLADRETADVGRRRENERLRITGAAGVVVEVACELGAERFEGALEELGDVIEQLADAIATRGPRARRAADAS